MFSLYGATALSAVLFIVFGPAQQKTGGKQSSQDPCAGAETQAEANRCTTQQYGEADARLDSLYRKLLGELEKELADARRMKNADQIKYVEKGLTGLKEAERAWIRYRDLHCQAAAQQFEGGSIKPTIWNSCMTQVTEHRIEELKQAYETSLELDAPESPGAAPDFRH